jgi:hypothetical protein
LASEGLKRRFVIALYNSAVLGSLIGVVAFQASVASLAVFAASNLVGLLIFDNRLIRRRLSMGNPWQQAGHLLAGAMTLAIPLFVFWHAMPTKMSACAVIFLAVRGLFLGRNGAGDPQMVGIHRTPRGRSEEGPARRSV